MAPESTRDQHSAYLRTPLRAAATLLGIYIGMYLFAAGVLHVLGHGEPLAGVVTADAPRTAAASAATPAAATGAAPSAASPRESSSAASPRESSPAASPRETPSGY